MLCLVLNPLNLQEEVAAWDMMQRYDMSEVTFRSVGPYLSLEVPGLAEKRPSLMMGDSVIATRLVGPLNLRAGKNEYNSALKIIISCRISKFHYT